MHDRPTILVPIRVLEGESFPEGTAKLLSNARVLLLGYHVVPEQTAPGQVRMQFETKAATRLEELETLLESAGAAVETRLVFTRNGQKTIDRMVYEHDCLAVLDPEAIGELEDVLVPIRGTIGLDRIARVVTGLFADTDADVTLYHVVEDDESNEDAQTLLEGLSARLASGGIDRRRMVLTVRHGDGALDAITDGRIRCLHLDARLRNVGGGGRRAVPRPGVHRPARTPRGCGDELTGRRVGTQE
jgi:nucleotide-binding universal stress UspA family protein